MAKSIRTEKPVKFWSGNCQQCGAFFKLSGTGAQMRRYCLDCRPSVSMKSWGSKTARYCQLEACGKPISSLKPITTKYCSKQHLHKAGNDRYEAKQKIKREAESIFKAPDKEKRVSQQRQGEVFDRLMNDDYTRKQLLAGEITATALAVLWKVSTAAITRAMHGILAEQAMANQRSKWQQSKRVKAMLPAALMASVKERAMAGVPLDDPEMVADIDRLVRAYTVFSQRYFNLEGLRPLIKDFHLRWIRTIIEAYATGGKRMILSPPRHGKSETLIRFVVWFICMDPNIRIGWFCASRDVAQLMLGSVKDIFENDEQLIADVLPPGELFDPGLKSNKAWNAKEIKVAQQSHVGAKSSSFLALGRTSKFLSRDMDIIVIDDLEDYDSTREEGQRIYSRNKLAEIGTRKVEETCEILIGSRQHPDDIPNHLLQLQGSILQWEVTVDRAHDDACGEDPDDFDVHVDCMLFPEVRSYRYLMEKKLEMETLGLGHLYPLRYQNNPIPEDGQVFDVQVIRDECLKRDRGIGLGSVSEGWQVPLGYLVGGLDPSARGIQASFLWSYRKDATSPHGIKMAMVDSDTAKSGGVAGAIEIILHWYRTYDLTLWFYETNAQQIEFYKLVKDGVAKAMQKEFGHNPIVIKEHSTGKNKQDSELGISAMAPIYHSGSIELPYGTSEARQKVNALLRQLELWTTDGVANRKSKTDIKMAQWFPFVGKIQSFMKEQRKMKVRLSEEASYPGLNSFNNVGWQTNYPGR